MPKGDKTNLPDISSDGGNILDHWRELETDSDVVKKPGNAGI